MGLFRSNYDKPGPGVEKDTPPKKGLARWWEVFTRDYNAMFMANLYFLVCCLPTLVCTVFFYISCTTNQPNLFWLMLNVLFSIPLGPALAALHRLTLQMARDVPFFTWNEFKKSYKTNFKQGAIAMLVLSLLGNVIIYNFYLLTVLEGYSSLTVIALFLSVYIWFSLLNTLFQQIAMMELPMGTIFRNSLLLVLASGWRGFVVCLIDIIVVLFLLLFSYIAAPLILFGMFALVVMTTDLIYWPFFKKVFIDHDVERRSHKSAAKGWDAAVHKQTDAEPTADELFAKHLLEDDEPETLNDEQEEAPAGQDENAAETNESAPDDAAEKEKTE